MIIQLLVSHELLGVYACWILNETEMYILVAFHLTSLSCSCLALDVFFGLCNVLLFLGIFIIRVELSNLIF